jgi:hypothetical protein
LDARSSTGTALALSRLPVFLIRGCGDTLEKRAMSAQASRHVVDTAGLIRAGILALPLSGALKLLGNLGTYDSLGYGIPAATEAATATRASFFLGQLAGSIVPVLLTPFWAVALFAYLAPSAGGAALTAGLVCCLLGAGFILPALGVITYAIPALGDAYLNGQAGAMVIADSFLRWPRGAIFYPAVLFPIGMVLFAVSIWRGRELPRTAGVLFALGGVLVAIPVPLHLLRLAGAVIGLAAGIWIAMTVWQGFRFCDRTLSKAPDAPDAEG